MTSDARILIRNTGWLLCQRAALVVSSLFSAIILPRLLGPDSFGRYSLIHSVLAWFVICSYLGLQHVTLRYGAEALLRGGQDAFRHLNGSIMLVRLWSASIAAVLFLMLCYTWLHDFRLSSLLFAACVIFARSVVQLFYNSLLSTNQAARWGAVQVVRGWGMLLCVPVCYVFFGFPGACAGMLLAEGLVFIPGYLWGRKNIQMHGATPARVKPHLRFALTLLASDTVSMGYQSSGAVIIKLFDGDYAEVGFFGLAFSVVVVCSLIIPQLLHALLPMLTAMKTRGEDAEMSLWLGRALEVLIAGCMLVLHGVVFIGIHAVPALLGSDYARVGVILFPIMCTLIALVASCVARIVAMIYERPSIVFWGSAIRLVTIWSIGVVLVPRYASVGGAIAYLVASILGTAYMVVRAYQLHAFPYGKALAAMVIGFCPMALLLLDVPFWVDALLFVPVAAAYVCALLGLRIMTIKELKDIRGILAAGGATVPGDNLPAGGVG